MVNLENLAQYVADFKTDFPEVAGNFEDADIEKSLGITDQFFGTSWGEYKLYSMYRQGWFNRAAHALFMSKAAAEKAELGELEGSVRGTDSVAVGDESTTFGTQMFLQLQPWEDELASTHYGVRFLELRDLISKAQGRFE